MKLPESLAAWVEDSRVVGTAGVTADRAVAILGDSAFIKLDDWAVVEKSWEDRELFGYVYGGSCSTVSFESAEGKAMRRLWAHRQALVRVRQLRMHWAEGLRLGWGLVVCGLGDSRWVRRVAGEMVAIVATDERYDAWARAGRPLAGLDLARRRAAGAEATAEVENRYRGVVFDRGVTGYLRAAGIEANAMSKERKAFARALGLMWSWAVGLRVPLGKQGVLPALVRPVAAGGDGGLKVAVPRLGMARSGVEASTIEVEVVGSVRARRLDAGLGGGGRVEQLARWLAGQLACVADGSAPKAEAVEALGYRLAI